MSKYIHPNYLGTWDETVKANVPEYDHIPGYFLGGYAVPEKAVIGDIICSIDNPNYDEEHSAPHLYFFDPYWLIEGTHFIWTRRDIDEDEIIEGEECEKFYWLMIRADLK